MCRGEHPWPSHSPKALSLGESASVPPWPGLIQPPGSPLDRKIQPEGFLPAPLPSFPLLSLHRPPCPRPSSSPNRNIRCFESARNMPTHCLPGRAATSSGWPPCLCSRKFIPLSHDCRAALDGPASTVLCHPLGATLPFPTRCEPQSVLVSHSYFLS